MDKTQFEHNLREYCLRPGVELLHLDHQSTGDVAMKTRLEDGSETEYVIPASDADRIACCHTDEGRTEA